MIDTKSKAEIDTMREGGRKLGIILNELLNVAQPGITLKALDKHADEMIQESGGTASFKTVQGYQWATCLCVNDVVVHGIPTEYILQSGDILTIDVGILYKGFHTDTAWTKIVHSSGSTVDSQVKKFLSTGQEALKRAIEQAKVGNRIGHISQAIQQTIEGAGYSIVKTLVGHGVGRELHEEPQIPGAIKIPIIETRELIEGMTIAIEVIYAMGSGVVVYDNDDGWSIATRDGSLSSVFEHTVAITSRGPYVLTQTTS